MRNLPATILLACAALSAPTIALAAARCEVVVRENKAPDNLGDYDAWHASPSVDIVCIAGPDAERKIAEEYEQERKDKS